ncbi:MAG: FAD-dependent oxidoreductase, partial [Pseudomonadota bacterium]
QDNALGTLFNIVGFQTKLKYGEQARIFRTIPGLQDAEFARLGGIHRNTFLNSPQLINERLQLKQRPALRFAGQITGVEGYVESAATGLIAGKLAAADALDVPLHLPPATSAHGALISHITGGHLSEETSAKSRSFQPMNVNFGLFPEIPAPKTQDGKRLRGKQRSLARKQLQAARALDEFASWLNTVSKEEAA